MSYEVNLNLIKETRRQRGISMDQMADKLKLANRSVYSKRENGLAKFKPEELPALCSILELSLNAIFLPKMFTK